MYIGWDDAKILYLNRMAVQIFKISSVKALRAFRVFGEPVFDSTTFQTTDK